MALDFPNSPSDGQVYTDSATGEQWVYEAATNSWTSKGLVNTSGGLVYKGTIDITAAPPAGVSSGWQYSVLADGTANAGFGPGITGTVTKGDIIMYTGTGWTDTSSSVPQATAAVAGIDKKLWKRSGTALTPETAADTVQISAGAEALPGLTPVGDPNTGVFSAGADQIGLATNGTGRLFVDASGNVGVGGTPNAQLNLIAGEPTLRWTDSDTNGFSQILQNDTSLYIDVDRGIAGTGALIFRTNGTNERLRITSDGKVGLGTSVPEAPVHISSAGNGLPATTGTTQAHGSLRIGGSATTGCIDMGPNSLNPWIQATDRTDLSQTYNLLLNPNGGNVGLGSSSADAQLCVAATASDTNPAVRITSSGSLANNLIFRCQINGLTNGMSMTQDASSNVNYTFEGGNVGINTTSPSAQFHVRGSANYNFTVAAGDSTTGMQIGNYDATDGYNPLTLKGSQYLFISTGGTERMRIKSDGIVNIANAPVYADNAAAKAGGLVAGDIYRKADGALMITF